jgi:hypothetical protein
MKKKYFFFFFDRVLSLFVDQFLVPKKLSKYHLTLEKDEGEKYFDGNNCHFYSKKDKINDGKEIQKSEKDEMQNLNNFLFLHMINSSFEKDKDVFFLNNKINKRMSVKMEFAVINCVKGNIMSNKISTPNYSSLLGNNAVSDENSSEKFEKNSSNINFGNSGKIPISSFSLKKLIVIWKFLLKKNKKYKGIKKGYERYNSDVDLNNTNSGLIQEKINRTRSKIKDLIKIINVKRDILKQRKKYFNSDFPNNKDEDSASNVSSVSNTISSSHANIVSFSSMQNDFYDNFTSILHHKSIKLPNSVMIKTHKKHKLIKNYKKEKSSHIVSSPSSPNTYELLSQNNSVSSLLDSTPSSTKNKELTTENSSTSDGCNPSTIYFNTNSISSSDTQSSLVLLSSTSSTGDNVVGSKNFLDTNACGSSGVRRIVVSRSANLFCFHRCFFPKMGQFYVDDCCMCRLYFFLSSPSGFENYLQTSSKGNAILASLPSPYSNNTLISLSPSVIKSSRSSNFHLLSSSLTLPSSSSTFLSYFHTLSSKSSSLLHSGLSFVGISFFIYLFYIDIFIL